jgi:hypothetical protein
MQHPGYLAGNLQSHHRQRADRQACGRQAELRPDAQAIALGGGSSAD